MLKSNRNNAFPSGDFLTNLPGFQIEKDGRAPASEAGPRLGFLVKTTQLRGGFCHHLMWLSP